MSPVVILILIATIFFVIGQSCLRQTFENTHMNALCACGLFSVSIGIVGIVMLLYCHYEYQSIKLDDFYSYLPILAGIVFALGNYCWISSIHTKESLGIIRVLMAGFETILLFTIGYLLFRDKLDIMKIIGTIVILLGIGIINYQ